MTTSTNHNVRAYCATQFFEAASFGLSAAVWYFFLTSEAGFAPGEAVLLTVLPGLVSAVFEVPTGSWADRFGRKRLYLLGSGLVLVSWLPFVFESRSLFTFLLAATSAGIGMAMKSGNLEALLHDDLTEQNKEAGFARVQANGYSFLFFGKGIASVAGGFLYVANPVFPYFGALVSSAAALVAVASIREPRQVLSSESNDYSHVSSAVEHLIQNKAVLTGLVILVAASSLSNVYYFSYQPLFERIGFSPAEIGLVFGGLSLVSAISSHSLGKWDLTRKPETVLFYLCSLLTLSGLGFLTGNAVAALFSVAALSVMGGMIMSLWNIIVLKNAPKTHKSTLLSLFSLAITGGYAAICLPSGYASQFFGITGLFWVASTLSAFCLFASVILIMKNRYR